MSFLAVLLIFIIWRITDFFILYLAPKFISYLGFFPYVQELKKFYLPPWIYSLANFDGVHYIKIAEHGYEQYEQAFFPLYPLVIKLVNVITHNSLFSGLLISNLLFLLGLYFLSRYLSIYYSRRPSQILWPVLFFILFPTSFFFGALYTEGPFFFFIITSLYFLEKKNYMLASVFGFLASLTRLMGIFLLIPFVIHLYQTTNKKYRILILSPIFGLLAYSLYLLNTTGDPFFFLTSQPIFGAQRSTNFVLLPQVFFRYIKIFFTARFDFQYFISLFEVITFTFVFFILLFELFKNLRFIENFKLKIENFSRFALNLFSLTNLLVPTLTGTFSSIPRYALLSFSFFIFLGHMKSSVFKIAIATIFLILHIVILGFFGQGYFVS